MAKDAAGYIVQSTGSNLFLSRTNRFVLHRDRSGAKGVNRAWVHSAEALLQEADRFSSSLTVYPARYDKELDLTIVTGKPMTFDAFLAAERQA